MRRFFLSLVVSLACVAPALQAAAAGGNVRVEIKDPKGAPVADAVASLTPLDAPVRVTPPAEPVVILQDNEEFTPYVTAIVVGTAVSFPNRDKVQHHVYSQSQTKPFEIPRYKGTPKETVLFDQAGIVTLGCNLHDWMAAYVVVLTTPHFAKSATDGLVPLAGLAPGRYRLEVWHPRASATVTREVTISTQDASTQVISVILKPDRRLPRNPESDAGGYK